MLKIKGRAPNKGKAWDIIGSLFLDIGHLSIQKNKSIVKKFLDGIRKHDSTCIIGASTIPLIQEIIKETPNTTVLDFSKKMCSDLLKILGPNRCSILLHDIISSPTEHFHEKFNYVLADQLINCLTKKNVSKLFYKISQMLQNGGEFRTIIKFGLYKIDEILLDYINKTGGNPSKFYNEKLGFIDYSKVLSELHSINMPNIKIPNELLIDWYSYRGEEVRFKNDDINFNLINSEITNGYFDIIENISLSDENLRFFVFKWTKRK
jgi:hypothetical protein